MGGKGSKTAPKKEEPKKEEPKKEEPKPEEPKKEEPKKDDKPSEKEMAAFHEMITLFVNNPVYSPPCDSLLVMHPPLLPLRELVSMKNLQLH
jgi:hypothetical protein